jgi:D-alanine-D-alanine ligase
MTRPRPDAPVVVVFGGVSAEHDVSVRSGTAIADALRAAGRRVQAVLIDLDGSWWWLPADHARAGRPASAYDDARALAAAGPFTAPVAAGILAAADPAPVAFLALHGPGGEDGQVQGMLDLAGVVYTGSDVTASAIGMDKTVFKRLADEVALPVVPWTSIAEARWRSRPDDVLDDLDALAVAWGGERLIVKPARLGSSIGMTIAHVAAERPAALDAAFAYDPVALVERCLDHPRELEVSVVGNAPDALEAFGPGEVIPGREFYDYAAKYLTDDAHTSPVADLPAGMAARVRDLALIAYRTAGAAGFARVDFLLEGETVYLSEINTIPGFTEISLFPQMCAAGGLPMPALCDRIVRLAVERAAARTTPRLAPGDLPR